jgi:hypothetical protein
MRSSTAPRSARSAAGSSGQGAQRHGVEGAGGGGTAEPFLEDAAAVAVHQVFPGVGAEYARPVDQDDALEVAADADVEEGAHAVPDVVEGRGGLGGELLVDEPLGHVARGLGHDRAEQVGLVAEVVVEGAAGDPGLGHDLLGAGAVEAVGGEQAAGRRDQRDPGVGRVLGPARRRLPGPRCRGGVWPGGLRIRCHTAIM